MGQTQWVLEAVEGDYTGRRFGLTERGLTLGREADNDLVLLDDNISRHHALIRISDGRPLLEDRNSRNGTFVNNQRVSRIKLKEGDRIAVGSHLFLMRALAADESPPEDTDAERTVIARPTPAQLRRTQAVQLFSPEAMAYRRQKQERENLASPPRPVEQPAPPMVTPEEEASGPILGGAAAAGREAGAASRDVAAVQPVLPPVPESDSRETVDDAGTVLLRADVTRRPEEAVPGPADQPSAMGIEAGHLGVPEADAAAPELEPVPPLDLEDAPPFDMPGGPAKGGSPTKRLALVGGGVAAVLILIMALYSQFTASVENERTTPQPTPVAAAQVPANDTASMFAFNGTNAGATASSVGLTEEEKALPKEERVSLANEHFDQGERYMESDKLNAALEEFQKALALNPECKVCVIRISKVQAEIRKEIEKYKSDALRAYQAMEYDKAKRYWEMVLELERDPAGRRVALDGLRKAIKQLKQQSYR